MLVVGPADARQRPVGDVERLHDGRHRGALHRAPLRPGPACGDWSATRAWSPSGLVGDAMARPLVEALASAAPGTYDTSTLAVVGSGGAMLSATVKDELQTAAART